MKEKKWLSVIVSWSVVLVFFSLYGLYVKNEWTKYREDRAAKLSKRTNIKGSVFRCFVRPAPPGFVVSFYLRLANSGEPSGVWDWVLKVNHTNANPDGYPAYDDIGSFREEVTADTNREPYAITQENYLPLQLYERGVSQERGAAGWVAFYVNDIARTSISPTGMLFTIQYKQGDGQPRSIPHLWVSP